jgi:hypothetical protein
MLNSTSSNHTEQYANTAHSSTTSINLNTSSPIDPSLWTINQVEEWLKKNNFNDCINILCHQYRLDGKSLLKLNRNDILTLTKNKQLWVQIKSLQPKQEQQSTTIQLESVTNSNQIEDQPITSCCFLTSIRSDRKKTLSAFLLALSTIFFCSFVITIVDERLPDPKLFPPLPDLILDNLEQIPWAFAVTEKIIITEMTTLILVILLHRHRSREINLFFNIYLISLLSLE